MRLFRAIFFDFAVVALLSMVMFMLGELTVKCFL